LQVIEEESKSGTPDRVFHAASIALEAFVLLMRRKDKLEAAFKADLRSSLSSILEALTRVEWVYEAGEATEWYALLDRLPSSSREGMQGHELFNRRVEELSQATQDARKALLARIESALEEEDA
jgi:hypothetical protein